MESQDFRVSIDLDEKKLGISLRKLIDNSFSLSLQKQAKISRKTSSFNFSLQNKDRKKVEKINKGASLRVFQKTLRNTKFSEFLEPFYNDIFLKNFDSLSEFFKTKDQNNSSDTKIKEMTTSFYGGRSNFNLLKKKIFSSIPSLEDENKEEILKKGTLLKLYLGSLDNFKFEPLEKYLKKSVEMLSLGQDLSKSIQSFCLAIKDKDFNNLKEIVSDSFLSFFSGDSQLVEKNPIYSSSQEIFKNIDEILKQGGSSLPDIFKEVQDSPEFQSIKKIQEISQDVSSLLSQLMNKGKSLIDVLWGFLGESNPIYKLVQKLEEVFKSAFKEAWENLSGNFSTFLNSLSLGSFLKSLKNSKTHDFKDPDNQV